MAERSRGLAHHRLRDRNALTPHDFLTIRLFQTLKDQRRSCGGFTQTPIPPKAQPAGSRSLPAPDTMYFRAIMRAITSRVHRDLPPTTFWSFGSTFPGPTFEARRGQGLWIDWINQLPKKHFLPIDHTLHGAEADKPQGRAVVHVHGAKVRPENDGYPDRWFDSGASASYYYPNDQDAATLWYHDHTMGINRLNVYAGLIGVYLIRDAAEDALNLPRDRYDVPLLVCDR